MVQTPESTNVGDGLWTSRSLKENAVCVRRGDVGIAPYTHHPTKTTNVGDGLWTSRRFKQRFRFRPRSEDAPHLQKSCPPSPGKGGRGVGCCKSKSPIQTTIHMQE